MSNPQNVQIPYWTFLALSELLETSLYPQDLKVVLSAAQGVMRDKKQALERRKVYSDYKTAAGAEDRDEKRIEYLQLKK